MCALIQVAQPNRLNEYTPRDSGLLCKCRKRMLNRSVVHAKREARHLLNFRVFRWNGDDGYCRFACFAGTTLNSFATD